MSTYGRDETLLPAQRRFSLSQEKHLRAERATSDADYPGERGELLPGGEGSLMLWGEGFQVATPSYCTPVVQSLQLLSALTVLLAEK